MDLSKLKWPIIIVVVVGCIWLTTSAGTDFLFKRYTKNVGVDAKQDVSNEKGLSTLGGFLLSTFRYEEAEHVLNTAVTNYPEGKNYYYNIYRQARCLEKLKDYQGSVDILNELMDESAHDVDSRVPKNDTLNLRASRLIEMHELQ